MLDNEFDLIDRAKKGDRSAFETLLETHYDMIHRVAYRFTGRMEDADDVSQDVCIALVEKVRSFRGDSSFKTWLYRVTVNACKDFHKKHKNRHHDAQTYIELEQHLRASSSDDARMIGWLYHEIAQLEESLKATALLVLAEDLSHAQAGKVLDCKESTISWRMHEIRKILKARKEARHE